MEHVYAVIMAGGIGSRFWPRSRVTRPKQFLPLIGGQSMIEATCERLRSWLPDEAILVVGSGIHEPICRKLLPWLPQENLLLEPAGRNTAPCIALAATVLQRRDPQASMICLPADHYIGDDAAFRDCLQQAVRASRDGRLLTIGIQPDRPETGYGYIRAAKGEGARPVISFHEKPRREQALEYLASGEYFWNSGIFVWQCHSLLQGMERHCPQIHQPLQALPPTGNPAFPQALEETFANLPSLSIDVGLMEPASREKDRVAVISSTFPWSDVGTWQALHGMREQDPEGNAATGQVVLVRSRGCLVEGGEERVIALVGMENTIVIDTEDALLVCRMDADQEVRAVIEDLKQRGWHEPL